MLVVKVRPQLSKQLPVSGLCHIFRRYFLNSGVFAVSNVAQTLLSVPDGEAALLCLIDKRGRDARAPRCYRGQSQPKAPAITRL